MPMAWHLRATSLPMRPRPTTPRVLPGEFDAFEFVLFPLMVLQSAVGLRNVAGESEKHGDGMFGRRCRRAARRVHHENAVLGGSFDVDVVDADTCASNHLQLRALSRSLRDR